MDVVNVDKKQGIVKSETVDDNEIYIPDDTIHLSDGDVYRKLFTLWHDDIPSDEEGDLPVALIPTDLMLSRTIPMPSFRITWDMWGHKYEVVFNLKKTMLTLIMFDMHSMGHIVVDTILIDEADGRGEHWAFRTNETLTPKIVLQNNSKDSIERNTRMLLCLWYGIQVLLLNPQSKVLFKNPYIEKQYTRVGKGKERKRVVKYVRKHYITPEGIDEALYGHSHRDFERKTMAWYVIGHWRQYKNGTRKFIKGYWKGPLREMKRSLDGGRIRQLAIQEV